jgi:hypothetical protein
MRFVVYKNYFGNRNRPATNPILRQTNQAARPASPDLSDILSISSS